jgi:hypothetical protein
METLAEHGEKLLDKRFYCQFPAINGNDDADFFNHEIEDRSSSMKQTITLEGGYVMNHLSE